MRWLLAPFIFILAIGLIGLLFKTANSALHFIRAIYVGREIDVKVELLEMIDLTLIAALVVVVIISVYGNFISRIDGETAAPLPLSMATVDFTQLKLKLMTTLVAISAVRLLEIFMDIPHFEDRDLYFYIGLHLTFVVSRLSMAYSARDHAGE